MLFFHFFPLTAESFGVSAQIGSGVVRGGPEVRFHHGSARVQQGSTRFSLSIHLFFFFVFFVLIHSVFHVIYHFFPLTAESFGVSAQTGSGVVRGGPEVRFHHGSARVQQGSTRFSLSIYLIYFFFCFNFIWFSMLFIIFPLTAESFGVSAQIGSGVVRGGPEVRFHHGSARGQQGSTRFSLSIYLIYFFFFNSFGFPCYLSFFSPKS